MSSEVRDLLLVGIKKEEPDAEDGCSRRSRKVTESVQSRPHRHCRRRITQRDSQSSESGEASSGDEWRPSLLSPSCLRPSTKTQNVGLPSTAASVISNEEFSPAISDAAILETKPLERSCPKPEVEDPFLAESVGSPVTVHRVFITPQRIMCHICGEIFLRRARLKGHIAHVHKERPEYTCEMCGKSLSTLGSLTRHVDCAHKKLRDHVCETCGRAFFEKSALLRHIDGTHKKVKRYTCGTCGKPFFQVRDLNTHMDVVHKRLLPYECEICGKRFPRPRARRIHADAVHKKLRKHRCDVCDRAFAQRHHLKRHVEIVHKKTFLVSSQASDD